MFGPIIEKITIDKMNNTYIFGELTNYTGNVNILISDESLINKTFEKTDKRIIVLSKLDVNLQTQFTNLFEFDTNSIFTNPIIKCDWNENDDSTYFSFNFSKSVSINNITYTTDNYKTLNTIYGKINNKSGEFIFVKHLVSSIYVETIDFDIDGDYMYLLAKYNNDIILDGDILRTSGVDNGFIIKTNKTYGKIITKEYFYSDEKLDLMKVNADYDLIYLSGSWSGNIYINRNIKTDFRRQN
jgi:hypothetical protein